MTSDASSILAAAGRNSLWTFVDMAFRTLNPGKKFHDNWHIGAVCEGLEKIERRETKRQIISVPPRHLKSLMCSAAFPAWVLGRNPTKKVIGASYGAELQHDLSGDTRELMEADWYETMFSETRLGRGRQTQAQIHTTRRGSRFATTVGGQLTGFGGNLIIVDDPMKQLDARLESARNLVWTWFTQTLLSRLDDKVNDAIVLVMQRLHEDDLVGRLLETGDWEYLCIPAEADRDRVYKIGPRPEDVHVFKSGEVIDPVREPKAVLDTYRRAMGTGYDAQYLQSPIPDGGTLFRWNWLQFITQREQSKLTFDFVFQCLDTASSADENASYSVCMTLGVVGNKYYITDVFRARLEFPDLLRNAKRLYATHKPDLLVVEATGIGISAFQQLRHELGGRVIPTKPRLKKEVRGEAITPLLERGCVYVPSDAPWVDKLRNEVISFPQGRHDDQVDCLVHLLGNIEMLMLRANKLGRRSRTTTVITLPTLRLQIDGSSSGRPSRPRELRRLGRVRDAD